MFQNFFSAFIFQSWQVQEYPPEEGERIGFRRDTDDALPVYYGASTFPAHSEHTEKLHDKAEAHDDDTYIIKVDSYREQTRELGSIDNHRGSSCDFFCCHPSGIIVRQFIHGRLLLYPVLNIQQRVNERDVQETEQGKATPLEEGIALAKEFIESIEQGNAYIRFQQINPFRCHICEVFGLFFFSFFN